MHVAVTEIPMSVRPGNPRLGPTLRDACTHLFVTQPRHRVDVLLLDHEGRQVGRVGRQEDDGEEGPYQHHDLTGGAFGVLDGDGVVEDDSPQQPHRLPNGEGGPARIWQTGHRISHGEDEWRRL